MANIAKIANIEVRLGGSRRNRGNSNVGNLGNVGNGVNASTEAA
jgi:hypothetical protein